MNIRSLFCAWSLAAWMLFAAATTIRSQEPVYLPPAPSDSTCSTCVGEACQCASRGRWFGGADFLYVRPHFSEAVAFARGQQTMTSLTTEAEPLDFDHDAAFRVFGGYKLAGGDTSVSVRYTHIDSEVHVNGTVDDPGEFIVDPFGAVVGQVTIIDPSSALAGMTIGDGDAIETVAEVDLDVWDGLVETELWTKNNCWAFSAGAGVRVASVDQYYSSLVTDGGALASFGDYTVDFTGAGPLASFELERRSACLDVFLQGRGAMLLGDYDVEFSAEQPLGGGVTFAGGQSETMTRLMPVAEMEVGGRWRASENLTLAGGYLFHTWWDFGTSGGTFAGLFTGQEDANIMSYDGLFLRAELGY